MDAPGAGCGASVRKLRGTADMSSAVDVEAIYKRRFTPDLASRQQMWRSLCKRFFPPLLPPNATVLVGGAGGCGVSNTIRPARQSAQHPSVTPPHHAPPPP